MKNNLKLNIIIEDCEGSGVPSKDRYLAYFDGDEYKGTVVTGADIADVMRELGISLHVLLNYRKKTEHNE